MDRPISLEPSLDVSPLDRLKILSIQAVNEVILSIETWNDIADIFMIFAGIIAQRTLD